MFARRVASILSLLLSMGLRAQTMVASSDSHPSPSGAVVAGIEADQLHMQREQGIEARRRQREFERQQQLERTERQRQLDRRQREVEHQRRQLLQLQARSDAQRATIRPSQPSSAHVTAEARQEPSSAKVQ